MNKQPLTEKEFEIINIIGDGFRLNQRQISQQTGLSLGMTNLLVRRLVTKGYLRIRQLNRKKVEYLLTTRSLSEKLRKTYHYTRKTIESFGLIRGEIREVVKSTLTPDITLVVVVGEGDLPDLTTLVLQEFLNGRCRMTHTTSTPKETDPGTLIINASTDKTFTAPSGRTPYIHLLGSLAEGLHKRPTESSRMGLG